MISVVICTHNRADYLGPSVRSVFAQTRPAPDHEILVVDNASTDGTAALVDALRAECPPDVAFRVVDEDRLGLSWARNAGIEAADGDIVAFLDDDAIADPGWLAGVAAAFARDTSHAVVSGPIEPIWPRRPPWWLVPTVWSYYTVLDYGPDPMALDVDEHFFAGANLSFRTPAVEVAGRFDTHLGRKGTMLLSNEDRAVVHRVAEAGGALWYEPAARVRHHVHPERMTLRWLFRRAFWQGVSNALADEPEDEAGRLLDDLRSWSTRIDALIASYLVRAWARRSVTMRSPRVPVKTLVNQTSTRGAAFARRRLARQRSVS